jgi:hypothetical protein
MGCMVVPQVGDPRAKSLWEWWHQELEHGCVHGPTCKK